MNEKNTIIQFPVLQKSCQWMYYTKYSTLVYSKYVVDQCVKIQWLKKKIKNYLSFYSFNRIHKIMEFPHTVRRIYSRLICILWWDFIGGTLRPQKYHWKSKHALESLASTRKILDLSNEVSQVNFGKVISKLISNCH